MEIKKVGAQPSNEGIAVGSSWPRYASPRRGPRRWWGAWRRSRRTGRLRLGCRKAPQIMRKELARSGEAAVYQPHNMPRSPWSWKTNGHA